MPEDETFGAAPAPAQDVMPAPVGAETAVAVSPAEIALKVILAKMEAGKVPTLEDWTAATLDESAYHALFDPAPAEPLSESVATVMQRLLLGQKPTVEEFGAAFAGADYAAIFGDPVVDDGRPKRPVRYIVDETRDQARQVGGSTVIFRPGEVISGYKLDLARSEGVQIREQ